MNICSIRVVFFCKLLKQMIHCSMYTCITCTWTIKNVGTFNSSYKFWKASHKFNLIWTISTKNIYSNCWYIWCTIIFDKQVHMNSPTPSTFSALLTFQKVSKFGISRFDRALCLRFRSSRVIFFCPISFSLAAVSLKFSSSSISFSVSGMREPWKKNLQGKEN